MITFNEGYRPQGSQEKIGILLEHVVEKNKKFQEQYAELIIGLKDITDYVSSVGVDSVRLRKILSLLRSIDILEKAFIFSQQKDVIKLENLQADPEKIDVIKENIVFFQGKNNETLEAIRDYEERCKE